MELTIHSQALGGSDLQAEFEQADKPEGLIILSHNAGGDMNNKIIKALAKACLERNISALRYNFHYVGGVGSEAAEWDDIAREIEAVYEKALELSNGPFYVGGKSLGSMASLSIASKHPEIKALGLFAIPKGMLEQYLDLSMLTHIQSPVYIYHGTEDRFGTPNEIEMFLQMHLGQNLHMIPMNDRGHGFEEQNSDEENQKLAEEMVALMLR